MNKLKQLFLKGKRFKFTKLFRNRRLKRQKGVIILSVLSTLLLLLLYLFISVNNVSSSRLDLFSLKQDYAASPTCHENCLLGRNTLRQNILTNISNDNNLMSDWRNYWQESIDKKQFAWQKELLKIALYADSKEDLNLYLIDYLINDSIDNTTKANIINNYLSQLDDTSFIPYYIYLLEEESENIIMNAAINALSNLSDKESLLNNIYLQNISNFIIDDKKNKSLKLDLIFLLSELNYLNPDMVSNTLKIIYVGSSDAGIKYFTADLLFSNGFEEYVEEIPDINWDDYLNY